MPLAHTGVGLGWDLAVDWRVIAGAVAFGLLTLQHLVVAHGRTGLRRAARLAVAAVVTIAVAAVLMPPLRAQPPSALPDLISDPPNPAFVSELFDPTGNRLVLTFDGYIHNVGEGILDVSGNPQATGGMRQRVRDGDEWVDVGSPTVRFETDDGHNHFHLIGAVEYVLWDELQGAQTQLGSKVGFCLVDSEQVEPGHPDGYSEDSNNYCEEDNPGATDLNMGISPGWRDIYDAATTLQWVDVTDVEPGRYWIGAITDPNDEIVESDETNNALIFSDRPGTVPGWRMRPLAPVEVDGAPTKIPLASTAYGDVGPPLYSVVDAPSAGALDAPLGASFSDPVVVYTPDPGFEGVDRFTIGVLDSSSAYPTTPSLTVVEVDVRTAARATTTEDVPPPSIVAPSTFFEADVGSFVTIDIEAVDASGSPARLFATGLPRGMIVDSQRGRLEGIPLAAGIGEVTLTAIDGSGRTGELALSWVINPPANDGGLIDAADRSSPLLEPLSVRFGRNALGATFGAEGLPQGLSIDPAFPVVSGTPTEVGSYAVTLRELKGDDVVSEAEFVWAIRPSAAIAFVL